MQYIHFIVNPISGKGNHHITKSFLMHYFPMSYYNIEVSYTQYKHHALELMDKIVVNKPDIVVACGGDGTIHEVASRLVNTNIALGIIPIGSGNGLASNLKIPKKIELALDMILKGNRTQIDVGKANNHYFFSNMGFGIDAFIVKKYESYKSRGFLMYFKACIEAITNFKTPSYRIYFNGKVTKIKPLLLFISNSNEMGYGMTLTPKASLQDGLLDFIVVTHINFIEKLYFGIAVFFKKPNFFYKYKHHLIKEIVIKNRKSNLNNTIEMQLDGEFYAVEKESIKIELLPRALNIIAN